MAQPSLQLEERHWFLGVVQLAGDRRACAVAGYSTTCILERQSGFAAQQRDECLIEVARLERLPTEAEEDRHPLTSFSIDRQRLVRSKRLPGTNGLAQEWIDGFG